MSLAKTLTDKVLALGEANEQFLLADYLRKNYAVITTAPDTGELHAATFDNSTEANAYAQANGGEIVVTEVTSTPKAAFWRLWKQFKAQIKAQGVYVAEQDGQFVVTDTKPTREQVLAAKGYGRRGGYEAPVFDKHGMIDRDEDDMQYA